MAVTSDVRLRITAETTQATAQITGLGQTLTKSVGTGAAAAASLGKFGETLNKIRGPLTAVSAATVGLQGPLGGLIASITQFGPSGIAIGLAVAGIGLFTQKMQDAKDAAQKAKDETRAFLVDAAKAAGLRADPTFLSRNDQARSRQIADSTAGVLRRSGTRDGLLQNLSGANSFFSFSGNKDFAIIRAQDDLNEAARDFVLASRAVREFGQQTADTTKDLQQQRDAAAAAARAEAFTRTTEQLRVAQLGRGALTPTLANPARPFLPIQGATRTPLSGTLANGGPADLFTNRLNQFGQVFAQQPLGDIETTFKLNLADQLDGLVASTDAILGDVLKRFQESAERLRGGIQESFEGALSGGFEAAFSLADPLKGAAVFLGGFLSGLGDIYIKQGAAIVAGATILQTAFKALASLSFGTGIGAGLALAALGATLKGIGSAVSGAVTGAGASAGSGISRGASALQSIDRQPVTVYIEGGVFNARDPRQRDQLAELVRALGGTKQIKFAEV
jgi:hypothetical protein